MDDKVYDLLYKIKLQNVVLIKLDKFESDDIDLLKAKENRSIIEYYFTCTPSIILYVFDNFNYVNLLTYLDADLYFFADPEPIFNEISDKSISIIEHRYTDKYKNLIQFGIYNVGWMTFNKDKIGLEALIWWREKCNDWCYTRLEDGKWADQKYLDDWKTRFNNVKIIKQKGANLGTWNIENYNLRLKDKNIFVDNHLLIFFHFHGFKKLLFNYYSPGWQQTKANKLIRDNIYKIYLEKFVINKSLVNKHYNNLSLNNNAHWGENLVDKSSLGKKIKTLYSIIYRLVISGNYVKLNK